MNEIKEYTETVFEDIKHIDELGNEYWYARELMPLLEYIKWENFDNVIQKAVISYKNSNNDEVNLLSESNRQTTPVTCFRFDNCLYYIRFFLFLQSPYMIF